MASPSLDDIRRDIDGIDDAILDLLIRRFEATAKVRASKSDDGSIARSPLRPAREATMLRRLISAGAGKLPAGLLVRLWRVILSASTQAQAPITLHVAGLPSHDQTIRVMLAEHFCGMPVLGHESLRMALEALVSNRSDLAVLATHSDWAEAFADLAASGMRVISSLPVVGRGLPSLLVFGHADPQPSGEDVTVAISRSPFSSESILWQIASGDLFAAALPGFLADDDPTLAPFRLHGTDLLIAGRLPQSIEVTI